MAASLGTPRTYESTDRAVRSLRRVAAGTDERQPAAMGGTARPGLRGATEAAAGIDRHLGGMLRGARGEAEGENEEGD
jgi:hypothetical protein